jgi:phage tail-like protein
MPGTAHGAVTASSFLVEVAGLPGAFFSRVELPQAAVDEVAHRAGGGLASGTQLAPGRSHYSHLVLSRALTANLDLWTWWKQGRDGDPAVHRQVVVRLLDGAGVPVMAWRFRGAFPAVHRLSPLDTVTHDPVLETVELAFDSMDAEI